MTGVAVIFVVGVVNLLLGYAMGLRWGYRPGTADPTPRGLGGADSGGGPVETPDEPVEPVLDESAENSLSELIQELISGAEWPVDSGRDEEPGAPLPDSAGSGSLDEAEPPFGADEDATAGRLLGMVRSADGHLAWLVDLDTRLRQTAGEYEVFTLLAWADELREGCQRQQADQEAVAEALGAPFEAIYGSGAAGRELAVAVARHISRLEEAGGGGDRLDMKGDLAVAAARLLEEIDRLQNAAHRLRDSLVEAFLAIARSEGRQTAIEGPLRFDALTKLPNRIGLETILEEWRRADDGAPRALCAAMFDLDNFAELNQTHGLQACDGVVRATAECIVGLVAENETLARCGGNRLVLLMHNVGVWRAADRAELVRRSIEATRFRGDAAEIRVTLSGGVAAAMPGETPESLLGRLNEALWAAKQSGRNSSFVHDGDQAELVDPADVEVEAREALV